MAPRPLAAVVVTVNGTSRGTNFATVSSVDLNGMTSKPMPATSRRSTPSASESWGTAVGAALVAGSAERGDESPFIVPIGISSDAGPGPQRRTPLTERSPRLLGNTQ